MAPGSAWPCCAAMASPAIPAQMTHAPDGPWYYQQIDLGFNYRMTELQAALKYNI
jgi:dTDP-4-amino-4,6-dideoxygalactose transaminase